MYGIFTYIWHRFMVVMLGKYSKKSPKGPTERTPKPGYLIALAFHLGVRW